MRSRTGTKWSETKRQKHKEKRKIAKIQSSTKIQTTQSQQIAKQVAEDIMFKVKTSIEEAINLANTQMPLECSYQQDA